MVIVCTRTLIVLNVKQTIERKHTAKMINKCSETEHIRTETEHANIRSMKKIVFFVAKLKIQNNYQTLFDFFIDEFVKGLLHLAMGDA